MADTQGDVVRRGEEEEEVPIPASKFTKLHDADIEKKKFLRNISINNSQADKGAQPVSKKERRHNTEILRAEVVTMLANHKVQFTNEGESSDDSGDDSQLHQFERKSLNKAPRRSILKHKDIKLEEMTKGLGAISEEKEEYSPKKKIQKAIALEKISTFDDFQLGWKYFQTTNDNDGMIKFLRKLDPKDITKVFPEGMDIVLKTEIMRKLEEIVDKDPILVKNLVKAFPNIKYFDLKMKCLMPKEKADVKKTIEKLVSVNALTSDEAAILFTIYKL